MSKSRNYSSFEMEMVKKWSTSFYPINKYNKFNHLWSVFVSRRLHHYLFKKTNKNGTNEKEIEQKRESGFENFGRIKTAERGENVARSENSGKRQAVD